MQGVDAFVKQYNKENLDKPINLVTCGVSPNWTAVNDYIRILSSGSTENVEVSIDNKTLSIDKDVNMDIISLLPRLKEEINELSINIDFIDRTLQEFGINKDNLCLNSSTKHIKKEKTLKSESESEYYYNPNGYLSK